MNSLILTFRAEQPLRLPLAYNQLVQGMLYDNWRETFPDLHDTGYSDGAHAFRLFTFGPLTGHYRIEGRDIVFDGAVRLEVRSPAGDLIDELADSLIGRGFIRLGRAELPLAGLSCADRLMFFPEMRIRMLSPVTVHDTLPDGKTVYYAPSEEAFYERLAANLAAKLNAAGSGDAPLLGCEPIGREARKRVTTFKGIYVTGYEGGFRLQAESEAMALLYYAGLGDRNSQGFGMFAIEDN